jgi:hypothetical protein
MIAFMEHAAKLLETITNRFKGMSDDLIAKKEHDIGDLIRYLNQQFFLS